MSITVHIDPESMNYIARTQMIVHGGITLWKSGMALFRGREETGLVLTTWGGHGNIQEWVVVHAQTGEMFPVAFPRQEQAVAFIEGAARLADWREPDFRTMRNLPGLVGDLAKLLRQALTAELEAIRAAGTAHAAIALS